METVYTMMLDLNTGKLNKNSLQEKLTLLSNSKTIRKIKLSNNKFQENFVRNLGLALRQNNSAAYFKVERIYDDEMITEIANALLESPTITHVDFSGISITMKSMEVILLNIHLQFLNLSTISRYLHEERDLFLMLRKNTTLQYLNLSQIMFGIEVVKDLAAYLADNTSLRGLDLSRNEIKSEEAKHLFKSLQNNRTLTQLNLSSNKIGPSSIKELTLALKENSALSHLDLSGNKLDSFAVKEMAVALLENNTLRDLNLSFNQMRHGDDAKDLTKFLLQNQNLISLNLSDNKLGNDAVTELAKYLRQNTTLTKLHLPTNIGFCAIKSLGLSLLNNNTLSDLKLTRIENSLIAEESSGPKAMKEVTSALMNSRVIRILDLSGNSVGPVGAEAIAEFLTHNRTVFDLNFSQNDIGAEGTAHIASALLKNDCLVSLNLSMNRMGAEGLKQLASALTENRTLDSLNISSNNINSIGLKSLADSLQCNDILSALNISGNDLSTVDLREFAAVIQSNQTIHILEHRSFESTCPQTKFLDICPEIEQFLARNLNLVHKLAFIANYIYTNKDEKHIIFQNIPKKDLEEFEEFQAQQPIIRVLTEFDISITDATKIINYTHLFIKTNYFEISGIFEGIFLNLPIDILCKVSSYLKLKNVHS